MKPYPEDPKPAGAVETLAAEIFSGLRRRFPVCLASDEFHYFPQVRPRQEDLQRWDDFSAEGVGGAIDRCDRWQLDLRRRIDPRNDVESPTDIRLLHWVLTLVREQLALAQPHTIQPTFYLTLAGIGLAQAYESNAAAWQQRLQGLPDFLASAQAQLSSLPRLFQARGVKMAQSLKVWLESLAPPPGPPGDLKPALFALERFRTHLERLPSRKEFRLPAELYARIAHTHLGIGRSLEVIAEELDAELEESRETLLRESAHLAPGTPWRQALAQMKFDPPAELAGISDSSSVYRRIIQQLEGHCITQGLITESQAAASPVGVAPVPDYLIPIRSAAAYSMVPGHPAAGGTFYLLPGDLLQHPPADIHLLSAHETYPGHHLLDTARWNLKRPLRRHLEFPLFYEGWASFAEELLFDTGFCGGSRDRLLMAKRRYYRALRGKTDLMLNQGRWSRAKAAAHLQQAGYPRATAEGMLTRYALKPGYQLCYSLGRRRFRALYGAWLRRGGGLRDFCAQVLSGGEVHLTDLEQRLQALNSRGAKRNPSLWTHF